MDNMGNNPFNDTDFLIPTNTAREAGKFVAEGDLLLPSYYDMEDEDIVKIYVSADNRKVVTMLSGNALRLFMWIGYELEYGNDMVWINRKRFMAEADICSLNTYKKGLGELTRYGLIVLSTTPEVYWINPRYLFKGSRIKKYANKIKR